MKNPFAGIANRISENNRGLEFWLAGYGGGHQRPRDYSNP